MGSDASAYIPSFIKIGSGIQRITGGLPCGHTNRQQDDLINIILFL
jgi:hypothetical protein